LAHLFRYSLSILDDLIFVPGITYYWKPVTFALKHSLDKHMCWHQICINSSGVFSSNYITLCIRQHAILFVHNAHRNLQSKIDSTSIIEIYTKIANMSYAIFLKQSFSTKAYQMRLKQVHFTTGDWYKCKFCDDYR
jgi:hypothetical protein